MVYHEQYSRYVGMVEETLDRLLPETDAICPKETGVIPRHLCESMRYSLSRSRDPGRGTVRQCGLSAGQVPVLQAVPFPDAV